MFDIRFSAFKGVLVRNPLSVLSQVYDPAKPTLIEGSASAVLSLLKIKDARTIHRLTLSDFPMVAEDRFQEPFGSM